ncbi:MAG: hypothetical protein JXR07_08680 [Reichenbachiella sp.]
MAEIILEYFLVYILSTLKVVFGMVLGTTFGFSVFITGSLTIFGMMTSVYVITFFGKWIRTTTQKIFNSRKKKLFTKKNRRNVRIWQQYGIPGIAILTPVLLMPIGGAVLANAFGGEKKDIFKWMWISCIGWTYPLTWMIKFASEWLPFFDSMQASILQWI